jgi:hypothetical protein
VHGRADAGVDANAVGSAVAHGVVDPHVELAPTDVGRGSLAATARVMTAADGVCALHVTADDADVHASFQVMRIRDLHAEERMRTIAAREVAVKTRGQLTAHLITNGADPVVRQRRLEADAARARAQSEADARVRFEAEAKVRANADLSARVEASAIYARQEYLFYLSGKCGAEPGRRERIAEHERRAREARLVAYADIAQRRDQAALHARSTLRAQLIALGAKERPPMPAPLPETPGTAPFANAEWTAGYWSWVSGGWEWQTGGWSDPNVFGDAGGDLAVGYDGPAPTRSYQTGTRDHRRGERIRDQRDDDAPRWEPKRESRPSEPSRTRDHRDEPRDRWTPKEDKGAKVRDHRDDDKKDKDDDKPRVRDHR